LTALTPGQGLFPRFAKSGNASDVSFRPDRHWFYISDSCRLLPAGLSPAHPRLVIPSEVAESLTSI